MNQKILFSALFLLILSSCKEVPPFIDFSQPAIVDDSTYVNPVVAAPQHKSVLIEDITGVRCVNCPQAAQKAKDILNQKSEDSVVVMAIYSNHLETFTTPYSGFPLLNNTISHQIVDYLGVPTGLPNGYIDRSKFTSSQRANNYPTWSNLVEQRLRFKTPVNINISPVLVGRNLSLEIKLEYTQNISVNHKFALYFTESGIISKQSTTTGTKDDYEHNHVLRHAFVSPVGLMLNGQLEPGRTFIKRYKYEIPLGFNIDKSHIICVVLDADTEEVVNVRQVDIR